MEELERLGLEEEEEDYSPLATILTSTLLSDEYVDRMMRGGWWQGEYALEAASLSLAHAHHAHAHAHRSHCSHRRVEPTSPRSPALQAVPWVASMPSDIGNFSGWDSAKYEEEYLKAFGGRTVYPAKVDSDGAGTFAALRTLGDAIEQQRHCGEDDNDTSMIGALHLGRRHRAGGLARDGRRGERAPQHVARRVLHQQHLLQRRRADGGDGLPCRAVPAWRGGGRAG